MPPHVVIVGAGFGGMYAARALDGAPVRITVVDSTNHHVFQPLLYQVATAALSPAEIAYPIRAALRSQQNVSVMLAEAQSVDVASRKVILQAGEIAYDYLIVATGCRNSYFGHDEWEQVAPGLKTVEDALEIRSRILRAFEKAEWERDEARRRELLTFVVIGGGPTGVELAGAISEIARQVMIQDFRAIDPREARVILVEAGPRILPGFPEDLSAKAQVSLQDLGVEVRTGQKVTALESERVALGDQVISAATILWAAGLSASPLARSLNVPLDRMGRVVVERDLSITGHPEVFVIGDLAAFLHQTDNENPPGRALPGVAPVAIQQGRHAGKNIRHALRGEPYETFHYFDKGNLATIGRAHAVADLGFLHLSGLPAWLAWLFVHIMFLIGFRNRFVVLLDWALAYLTFRRSARLIVGRS